MVLESRLKMSAFSRTWLAGSRWQSRQKPMLMGFICVTTSIRFTLPWHSTQLMPAVHVDRVVKVDEGRHHVDVDPRDRLAGLEALPHERQVGAVRS